VGGALPEGELLVLRPLVHLGGLCCAVLEGGDGGTFGGLGGCTFGGLTFLLDLSKELLVDKCGAIVCRLLIGSGVCCELCGLLVTLGLKPRLLCGVHFGAFALSGVC